MKRRQSVALFGHGQRLHSKFLKVFNKNSKYTPILKESIDMLCIINKPFVDSFYSFFA